MYCFRKGIIFFLLLAGALSCFSCKSTAHVRDELFVWITGNSKYILLPPRDIENTMDMLQLISASYGGQEFNFNAWVSAGKTGIDMTLLNELGTNLGELSWNGDNVFFSSTVFPKSVRGEYIIADFQLCFYNTASLKTALKKSGLSIEDTQSGRRIYNGKTLIIEIIKSTDTVRFVNHLRGYAYTMQGEF